MNRKVKYLGKNIVLFTISSFGSKLLTFLLVPLYTNVLSTSEYGTADIVHTTATLLIYVFTLNIADAVLRFTIETNSNKSQYLSFGINVLFKGSLLLVVLEILLYNLAVFELTLSFYCFLFLTFFATAANQLLSNYLRAIDKIREVAVSGILTTLVTVLSNIFFLLIIRIGLNGYLFSIVLGNAISTIYMILKISANVNFYPKAKPSTETKKAMIYYSAPLIFNGIAWWMNNSIDKYFITAICGVALSGIYSIAYKIPTFLSVFQTIFNQAWNLSAIKEFDKDDKDNFFSITYGCYSTGLFILSSILIIANRFIARLLFAKEFYEAWHFAPILLLSFVFMALSGFIGSVFSAVRNSKIFALSTVTSAIVNIVLNALLIPVCGAYGAAIATLVSFFLTWLIRFLCSRKYIALKTDIGRDFACYLILVLQVVVELKFDMIRPIQALFLLALIVIKFNYVNFILYKFSGTLMHKQN